MGGSIREVSVAGRVVTIHERDGTNDPITGRALTGSWLWASSVFLSEWLVGGGAHHETISLVGKTVLELGAGTGLPGITASLLGARRVVLTDVAPLLPGLRVNVGANGLEEGSKVEVRELKWGDDVAEVGGEIGEVDLVLMSDVFYDPEEMEELARTLKGVMRGDGTTMVLAGSEVRGSTEECLEVLEREGFQIEEVVVTQELGGMEEEGSVIAIYAISRNEYCSQIKASL